MVDIALIVISSLNLLFIVFALAQARRNSQEINRAIAKLNLVLEVMAAKDEAIAMARGNAQGRTEQTEERAIEAQGQRTTDAIVGARSTIDNGKDTQ